MSLLLGCPRLRRWKVTEEALLSALRPSPLEVVEREQRWLVRRPGNAPLPPSLHSGDADEDRNSLEQQIGDLRRQLTAAADHAEALKESLESARENVNWWFTFTCELGAQHSQERGTARANKVLAEERLLQLRTAIADIRSVSAERDLLLQEAARGAREYGKTWNFQLAGTWEEIQAFRHDLWAVHYGGDVFARPARSGVVRARDIDIDEPPQIWERIRQAQNPGGAEVIDALRMELAELDPDFVLEWMQYRGLLVQEALATFAGDATAALSLGNRSALEDTNRALDAIQAAARKVLLH